MAGTDINMLQLEIGILVVAVAGPTQNQLDDFVPNQLNSIQVLRPSVSAPVQQYRKLCQGSKKTVNALRCETTAHSF